MINLLIKTTESPRDDDSLNLKEGQLHSLVEAVSEQGVTLEHQGNIIIGLNENYDGLRATVTQQGTTITGLEATVTEQGTTITGLEATVTQQGTTIKQQGTTITGLEATVKQQGTTITGLSRTMDRMLTKSRVAVFRIAIQDLNSSFGLLGYFGRNKNTGVYQQLRTMNNHRVHGAHFMLVDPKVKKPLLLDTYKPNISVFDGVPALCYKILLLRQFILGPSFPKDIEEGLGVDLIAGLKNYLTSELTNSHLAVNISEMEKKGAIQSAVLFFEDVPEFITEIS